MSVCFLTRATCKNVKENLIPRATAYGPGPGAVTKPGLLYIVAGRGSLAVTAWDASGPSFRKPGRLEKKGANIISPRDQQIINQYNENEGVSMLVHELEFGRVSSSVKLGRPKLWPYPSRASETCREVLCVAGVPCNLKGCKSGS